MPEKNIIEAEGAEIAAPEAATASDKDKSAQTETKAKTASKKNQNLTAKYTTRRKIDPHSLIPVINGTAGRLVFRSSKSGELYEWDKFGDVLDIEFQELQAAKGRDKAFYENNWFLFIDPDVIDALGVERYYKNSLHIDDLDTLFDLPTGELTEKVSHMGFGQKRSLAYLVKPMIDDGRISDLNVIRAIEAGLGIELIAAVR